MAKKHKKQRRVTELVGLRPVNHAKGIVVAQEGFAPPGSLPLQYGATWVLDCYGEIDATYSTTWGWVCDQPTFQDAPPGLCHTVSFPSDTYEVRVAVGDLIRQHGELGNEKRVFVFAEPYFEAWVKAGCQVDNNTGYLSGGNLSDPLIGDPDRVEKEEAARAEAEGNGVNMPFEDIAAKLAELDEDEENLDDWPDDQVADEQDREDELEEQF